MLTVELSNAGQIFYGVIEMLDDFRENHVIPMRRGDDAARFGRNVEGLHVGVSKFLFKEGDARFIDVNAQATFGIMA